MTVSIKKLFYYLFFPSMIIIRSYIFYCLESNIVYNLFLFLELYIFFNIFFINDAFFSNFLYFCFLPCFPLSFHFIFTPSLCFSSVPLCLIFEQSSTGQSTSMLPSPSGQSFFYRVFRGQLLPCFHCVRCNTLFLH